VYRIAPDRALVATVDFFTPIVDDPSAWGAIAAANALSDVYAMGGKPIFALNVVGWPRGTLSFELLGDVTRGASEVMKRAGCLVLGGHSVDDAEPKFGFAVVGEVHPDRMLTLAAARPGDRLVLTKPLGTGILATALKRDLIGEAEMAAAVDSMTTLNAGAAWAAREHGVRAATDVTGFGLIGHLGNMMAASGVGARIGVDRLPVFAGVLELASRGCVPGGTTRNLENAMHARFDEDVSGSERILVADAQTSGGLLLAVSAERAPALLAALRAEPTHAAADIGGITAERGVLRIMRNGEG
jgi:selenide,water dikinase